MLISEFKILLAKRLEDVEMVYWTSNHLDLIIDESLLTFAAISGYWKDQLLIETTDANSATKKQFYNLLDSGDVKIGFEHIETSLTYEDIINWIDMDLIDYTQIVSLEEVIDAITNAINDFQSETKLVLARERFDVQVTEDVEVSANVLDIVKAYYIDVDGNYFPLQLSDENRVTLINRNYTIDLGKPKFYSISNLALNRVDLFPKPNNNGQLELIYIKGKSGVQTAESNCLIPNNLVPYLKYKVEADLFSKDGLSNDPARADYCNKRWLEGLLVGNNYVAITNSKLNGLNKSLSSLQDFDAFRYGWLNEIENAISKVNGIALAGYNILAVNREPIDKHSVLLEIVSNANLDDEEIELRSDYVSYLLDYCLHLASFKDGIANIQKTSSNLEKFVQISVDHNSYLQKRRISYLDLLQKSRYPIRQAKVKEEQLATT
jgi:hypothetical protein